MKRFAAVLLILALGAGIRLQAGGGDPSKPAGADAADMSAMMPKPGNEHRMLTSMVGTWNCDVEVFPMPGAPAMKSKGTEEVVALGEFWTIGRFKGEMMGMPFEGQGISGYDPVRKKFTNYWIDSMTPTGMMGEGTWNEEKKELVLTGRGVDPMGSEYDFREVMGVIDADTRTFSLSMVMPDGTEFTMLNIKYARVK